MVGIEIIQGRMTIAVLSDEFEKWVNEIKQNGTLRATMDDLKDKAEFHRRKLSEFETALRALEAVSEDGLTNPTVVLHSKEFERTGIAEAAVIIIRRAKQAMHIRDIAEALQAGGYISRTDNLLNSIAPILFLAAKNKKHGIVSKGKNTYSLKEVEDRTIQ